MLKNLVGVSLLSLALVSANTVLAQAQQQSAKAQSPHDLSGYWVSLVTEDWRFRMIRASAGDYDGITLTPAGQALANSWDAETDAATGAQCKAYGAGGLMRMPTRLHIDWASDNVLSIETDAGKQTRLLKFAPAQDNVGSGSLQGVSKAQWKLERAGRGGPVVNGSLQVHTTNMAPGYVRRNGVPYSDQAQLSEFFELVQGADGTEYLIVISELTDPLYLGQPVLTSTNFKREKNSDGYRPRDCE